MFYLPCFLLVLVYHSSEKVSFGFVSVSFELFQLQTQAILTDKSFEIKRFMYFGSSMHKDSLLLKYKAMMLSACLMCTVVC